MKKINNGKYRGNNNTIYSLNYKFDSVCSAGKFCGTALDLIKKYNELAKEAHSNGDYVEMEVFRQYAEHYRKIVTEINERKNTARENTSPNDGETGKDEDNNSTEEPTSNNTENSDNSTPNNNLNNKAETEELSDDKKETTVKKTKRRSFTIVEVADKTELESGKVAAPKRRTGTRRTSEPKNAEEK